MTRCRKTSGRGREKTSSSKLLRDSYETSVNFYSEQVKNSLAPKRDNLVRTRNKRICIKTTQRKKIEHYCNQKHRKPLEKLKQPLTFATRFFEKTN